MPKTVWTLVFLMTSHLCVSQGFSLLQGQVLRAEDELPLLSVVITMPSTAYNTSVNEEGYYRLKYPKIAKDSLLIIGAVGYETIRTTPRLLSEKPILLRKTANVEASLGLSDAKTLIAAALDSIPTNYPRKAFRQDGFFMESAKVEKVGYVMIKEAQVRVERFPEQKTIFTKSKLLDSQEIEWPGQYNKVRAFSFENAAILVTKSFETEVPEFLTKKKRKHYDFNIDSYMVPFLDEPMLSIRFTPSKKSLSGGRSGRLYMHPYTKAIVRIEYELSKKGMDEVFISGLSSLKITGQSVVSAVQYVPLNDKWVLGDAYIKFRAQFEERLDQEFDTAGSFMVRFTPHFSTRIKRSTISEFYKLENTQNFKKVKYLSSGKWQADYCLLLTSEMLQINENLYNEK